MSWAKLDDGHDDSAKVRRALRDGIMGLAAIGLHTLAISQSARRETDGLVDIDWLDEKLHRLSPRERARLMEVVEAVGFLNPLAAGEAVELTDTKGFTVTVGPITEDAHLVNDFLEYNDSSAYMSEKRRADAERKANGRRKDSARSPRGRGADSGGSPDEPRARGRVPDPTRPDPTIAPPGPPPSGGRRRDAEKWERTAIDWLRSIGVDGNDQALLWVAKGAEPWRDEPAAEARVRAFIERHPALGMAVS